MNIYGNSLEKTKARINEIVADDDTLNGEEKLLLHDNDGSIRVDDDWILGEPTGEDSSLALIEMLVGILAWSIILELSIVWFVSNKLSFSIGLLFGSIFAAGLAYNMWYTLKKAMDMNEKGAKSYLASRSIIRYISIVIVLGVVMSFLSGIMHPLAVFTGIMTLKAGAYSQPIVDKIYKRIGNN